VNVISFTVIGVPQPKGSARAFTYQRRPEKGGGIGARVDHDNPRTRQWERDVAKAAQAVRGQFFCKGPVRLTVVFDLARPQWLRDRMAPHLTRPDCDKLVRSIGDAIRGVFYADDAQVIEIHASKRYAGPGRPPCATVRVTALEVEQPSLLQKGA
jgi:crossover junction endodeoxyribonuclease RusA